jgi:hypothetical protein
VDCHGGESVSPKAIVCLAGGVILLTPNGFGSLSLVEDEMTWGCVGRGSDMSPGESCSGRSLTRRGTGSGGDEARFWATGLAWDK